MAVHTVEEIFNGTENKYSVMSDVAKEILRSGPYDSAENEQTAIKMDHVKHTINVLLIKNFAYIFQLDRYCPVGVVDEFNEFVIFKILCRENNFNTCISLNSVTFGGFYCK